MNQSNTNIVELSIVMPFFNHKEMVAEMIDSIQANDYQNWELLAIDDGSTEDTWEFLKKRYQNDTRILLIHREREPKGAQTCRNMGLELARGEYIIFFDSDDTIASFCLSNRIEEIKKRPECDFVVFPSGTYKEGSIDTSDYTFAYGRKITDDDIKIFAKRILPFIVWNNIYRTESLRSHHITWDTHLLSLQDSDFNMEVLMAGLKYTYVTTEADYGYRTGVSNSISKKIASKKHMQSFLYLQEKQYRKLQERFGSKYNKALYLGVLNMYSTFMSEKIDYEYAYQLANLIKRYDSLRGRLLLFKIKVSFCLEKVLSPKIARQLSMPLFLLQKRWMEQDGKEKMIRRYRKNNIEQTL